jgi:hypothetical protein
VEKEKEEATVIVVKIAGYAFCRGCVYKVRKKRRKIKKIARTD